MPKLLINGPVLKIAVAAIGAIVLGAGGYAATRAVTSVNENEVRVIINDKVEPIREMQKEIRLEIREQSQKINSLNEKQTKALTILDLIEKKL